MNANKKDYARFHQVFPVAMLSGNRPCLVVGGGKIATRKTGLLLESGAKITVVAPKIAPELKQMAAVGKIVCLERNFKDADLDGIFMVFAATNDRKTNKKILQLCESRSTMACSVDSNWGDGDFVTPAILRHDGLTIAVSTGGKSCRRAKLIKESLNRHIDMVKTSELMVMGISHESMSVEEREPYHLLGDRLQKVGEMIMHVWGVHEFVLLNTCNRVELLAVVAKSSVNTGILEKLLDFHNLPSEKYYLKFDYEAFEHLATLCAGLYSQSPGEKHIVSQVKEALSISVEHGWSGGILNSWVSTGLHISKHIRQMFEPQLKHIEIEELAMQYLHAQFLELSKRSVMVIGTGVIGQGIVRECLATGAKCVWCYHNNKPQIPDAWQNSVQVISFADIATFLPKVSIVICAASGEEYILQQWHIEQNKEDIQNNLIIIDLAMPRNVDPKIIELLSTISIVDLDSLKRWHRQNVVDLSQILEQSKQIVKEHFSNYEQIVESFQGRNQI